MNFQTELLKHLHNNKEKTAIEDGSKHITYGQLLSLSNKVTKFLLAAHIGRETVVGINLTDRTDIISTLIGVINAGCTFVLISGTLPEKRLGIMLEDLNLQHLITSSEFSTSEVIANKAGLSKYYINDIIAASDGESTIQYPEFNNNDSLYIYFTSGTTGIPKGIVGKNGSLLQFINWEITTFSINESNRFSQFVSPYFDAFLRDIFVPLFSGGIICITPNDEEFFSPEKMIDWLDRNNINAVHCVPSVFRVFNTDALRPDNFRCLKYIFLSGERIFPAELINWYNVFNDRVQLVNLYGPTETTMVRFFYKILPADTTRDKMPVGTPISDTDFLITSNGTKANPALVPGDLHIISEYTTKGYLNAPELTARKFVKLHSGRGSKLISFKTGDKARLMSDGKVDLLGRDDRQVKLRGVRIELDEIERIIFKSGLVKNAVVIKHSFDKIDEWLVAFVISRDAAEDQATLKERLFSCMEAHLPKCNIPSDIVVIDEVPVLSNGKVDFTRLAKSLERNQAVLEPINEIEEAILSVWKEIFGNRKFSTDDNFHAIGGNSLGMMKLIGKLYKVFNVRVTLSDLFHNLTIKKQAVLIKKSKKDDAFIISKAPLKSVYNTSAAQQRLFYSYELDKSSKAYNLPVAWKVKKGLDKKHLKHVLNQLAQRHESLRTSFKIADDEIVQVVEDEVDIAIEELHCKNASVGEVVASFIRPFDLEAAPLVRCGFINADGDNDIVLFDAHHIICDGMSQMNLYGDFIRLTNGETLEPLEIQYKDYAEWEYKFRDTEAYLSQRHFWLKSFEGCLPKLSFPLMSAADADDVDNGGQVLFEIEKSRLSSILQSTGDERVTPFAYLFSLYFIFLSQLTGQDEIVIGVPTSGRTQEELEKIVGMFIKTLPIRYRLNLDNTFIEEVKKINNLLIDANNMQMYDLADMLKQLNAKLDKPLEHLFDVMFVFQNFENTALFSDFINYTGFDIEKGASKYPLSMLVNESSVSYGFQLVYSKSFFSESDIQGLVNDFRLLIDQVAANTSQKLVQYLGAEEKQLVVLEDDFSFDFK